MPFEDIGTAQDAGCVIVIYGSKTGLEASINQGAVVAAQIWHQDRPGVADVAEQDDRFGWSVASGDFDQNGFDDLAIGAPNEDGGAINSGALHILYGHPTGLSSVGSQYLTSSAWGEPEEQADFFGYPLEVGDFNGDTVDDLAIGCSSESTTAPFAGTVHIAFGFAGGVLGPAQILTQDQFGDPAEQEDRFGFSLAAGDVNGDGFTDLAIGAVNEDYDVGGNPTVNVGMVHVALGRGFGLEPSPTTPVIIQSFLSTPDISEANDQFGFSVACGDVNGDGAADLIVGARFEDHLSNENGALNYIPGILGGLGVDLGSATWISQETFGPDTSEPGDEYGFDIVVADVYPNGVADILASAPGEALGAAIQQGGEVNIIRCAGGGPGSGGASQDWSQDTSGVLDKTETFDQFGWMVLTGDFNNDGFLDIVIGAPAENVGTTSAGMINVLYGTPTGPSAAGDQIWHQNRPGVPDAIEQGDLLGYNR